MNKKWIWIFVLVVITILGELFIVFHPLHIFFKNDITLGEHYSGGQLFFEILLIPIAIIGFYITYEEFQKRQDKAKLRLYWESGNSNNDQTITIKCKKGTDGRQYLDSILTIVLLNDGDIIPSHYLVIQETNWNINSRIKPHIGIPIGSEHWKKEFSSEKLIIKFFSHGEFPAYPGVSQKLFSIDDNSLPFSNTYIEKNSIAYTIYSDKSNKVTGTLTIEITD
jgi:hypothetical protein